jgi:hypothetical protein
MERFWQMVKAEVLNAAHHGIFGEFTTVINSCITETREKHKKKVSSLISDNFHLFTDVYVLANDIFMAKGAWSNRRFRAKARRDLYLELLNSVY